MFTFYTYFYLTRRTTTHTPIRFVYRTCSLSADCRAVMRAWRDYFSKSKKIRFPIKSRWCSWLSVASATELLGILCPTHQPENGDPIPSDPQVTPLHATATLNDRADRIVDAYDALFSACHSAVGCEKKEDFEELPDACYSLGQSFRQFATASSPLYMLLQKERRRTVLGEAHR